MTDHINPLGEPMPRDEPCRCSGCGTQAGRDACPETDPVDQQWTAYDWRGRVVLSPATRDEALDKARAYGGWVQPVGTPITYGGRVYPTPRASVLRPAAGCQNRTDLRPMAMLARDVRPGMQVIRHRDGEPLPAETVRTRVDRPAQNMITFDVGPQALVTFSLQPDDVVQVVGEDVRADELGGGDVVRLPNGWTTLDSFDVGHAQGRFVRAYVDPAWELAQAQQPDEPGWSGYPGTRR